MKHFPRVLSFWILWSLAPAAFSRALPLQKGGVLQVPDQVMVTAEGISFVRPGEPAPTLIAWQTLDLPKLAKLDAQLEESRQKAILTGQKTLLAPEISTANPYAVFLHQPIKVTFRARESHQTKVEAASVATAVPPVAVLPTPSAGVPPTTPSQSTSVSPAPATNAPTPTKTGISALSGALTLPQQIFNNVSTKRTETTVDQTRQPLDTTLDGLLELISDASQSSSGNLLRELREQPHIFTNILNELRTLQTRFPSDSSLPAMAEALQKLAKNGPVSVDAQNAIRRALATLRVRSKEQTRSK